MTQPPRPCLLQAWHDHEGELRGWLQRRLRDDTVAEDMLQSLFLKALRQGERFCEVQHARAWLYRAARNALIDRARLHKDEVPLPELIELAPETSAPVESMATCLPRALRELPEADADILRRCDLEQMTQRAYAELHGLSIPGAKSRLQRARRRLKTHLTEVCQVQFDEQGQVCCFVPREGGDATG